MLQVLFFHTCLSSFKSRRQTKKTFALLRSCAARSTALTLVSACAFHPLDKLVHALKIRQALLKAYSETGENMKGKRSGETRQ
jgi:hypothetical protein